MRPFTYTQKRESDHTMQRVWLGRNGQYNVNEPYERSPGNISSEMKNFLSLNDKRDSLITKSQRICI